MESKPLISGDGNYTYGHAAPPPYTPQPPQPTGGYHSAQQSPHQPIVVEHGHTIPQAIILAPPDYTVLAIIATVCFFPLGLLALSFVRRSKESMVNGDPRSAYSEALSARIMSRLAISIGTMIISGLILAIVLPIYLSS